MSTKYNYSCKIRFLLFSIIFSLIQFSVFAQYIEDTNSNTTNENSTVQDANKSLIRELERSELDNLYQTENIGENITDKILSVKLEAQNVVFSLQETKKFELTITNISNEIFSLNLSDNYIHNIFFDVYDELDFPVTIQSKLLEQRNTTYISYRNIVLYPTEFFTITLNLDDFVIIEKPGVYKVSTRFYPFLYSDVLQNIGGGIDKYVETSRSLVSIVSVSNVAENNIYDNYTNNYSNISSREVLITRPYNPYDVVNEVMSSLMKKEWGVFFSHTDMLKLYTNAISNLDTFNLLSKSEQKKEIQQFMKRLEEGNEQNDLYPPNLFTIEETRYTNNNANVTVLSKVMERYEVQLYKYNFKLQKQDAGWKITDYTSTYLGIDSINVQDNLLGNATDYRSPIEFQNKNN